MSNLTVQEEETHNPPVGKSVVLFPVPLRQTTFSVTAGQLNINRLFFFSLSVYLWLLSLQACCSAPSHAAQWTWPLTLPAFQAVPWKVPTCTTTLTPFPQLPLLVRRNSIPCPCDPTPSPMLCPYILNVQIPALLPHHGKKKKIQMKRKCCKKHKLNLPESTTLLKLTRYYFIPVLCLKTENPSDIRRKARTSNFSIFRVISGNSEVLDFTDTLRLTSNMK